MIDRGHVVGVINLVGGGIKMDRVTILEWGLRLLFRFLYIMRV
jgi:hypothetical protein